MKTLTRPKIKFGDPCDSTSVSRSALLFFTHFVKWLDNPLFTGDDRREEQTEVEGGQKTVWSFGSGKMESILKFVSRLFLVIAANLADNQASGLVME